MSKFVDVGSYIVLAIGIITTVAVSAYLTVTLLRPNVGLFVISGNAIKCQFKIEECGVHLYSCDEVSAEIHCAHNLVQVFH